ncbi:MAG: serine/threonine protein kinase [Clostridiales bacterium]|nr:serine/threonine protein kinase [Clostridiales bacterium]
MGKVLKNRYELLTELGHGGMSTVYLARDLNLGSYWAVKHMKNNASTELLEFKKESELLAGLNHPDIPRIVDRIEDFEDYYVVMDFVDGVSLGKLIVSEGPISEEKLISWSKMLCSILQYLHTVHADPIVYRDMKPDNIILSQSGRVKLIDFGIAKECKRGVRDDGECYGTRGYAAPEQYKSGSNILDERTDIYSLGCTMFYLVTGKVPGKAPNACPPVRTINPNLSEGIQYIISKATADDPKDRYQNTDEMLGDLEHITELSSEYREKMRKRVLAFVVCLILAVVFAGVSVWGYFRIQQNKYSEYQRLTNMAYEIKLTSRDSRETAANYLAEAVQYNDADYSTFKRMFDLRLPTDGEENSDELRRKAIDSMCKYIDNPQSSMHDNITLRYDVACECLKLTGDYYNSIAINYFEYIIEAGDSAFPNVKYYSVIAKSQSSDSSLVDNEEINDALDQLEKETRDSNNLTTKERLENYSLLITTLSSNPQKYNKTNKSTFDRIQELGVEARELLENSDSEDLDFRGEYQLYLTLGGANYLAGTNARKEDKNGYYQQAIEWYELVVDKYGLSQDYDFLYMANSYKNLGDNIEPETTQLDYYKKSISVLEQLTSDKPDANSSDMTVNGYDSCRYSLGNIYIKYAGVSRDNAAITKAKEYVDALEGDDSFNKDNIKLLRKAIDQYNL